MSKPFVPHEHMEGQWEVWEHGDDRQPMHKVEEGFHDEAEALHWITAYKLHESLGDVPEDMLKLRAWCDLNGLDYEDELERRRDLRANMQITPSEARPASDFKAKLHEPAYTEQAQANLSDALKWWSTQPWTWEGWTRIPPDVLREMGNQNATYGPGADRNDWIRFMMQELGEVAQAIDAETGLRKKPVKHSSREELVQLCGVCLRALADWDGDRT